MRPAWRRLIPSGAALLALALVLAGRASAECLLRPGDRMVFLGDSITQQRIYTRYVMDYFALRYPDLQVTFRNAGVGGDTAVGAIKRLDTDVLSAKPDLVSICFGMNDAGYTAFDQARCDEYIAAMTVLVAELKKAGSRVVLLTPGCVDPDRAPGWMDGNVYNATLTRYAAGVKDLAAARGLPVYDIDALMLDVQARAKAANPEFTMIPDAVHPNEPGQALMAYGLVKALGCADQASGLQLDAASKAVTADRCLVRDLSVSDSAVTFTRTDQALPTYFDPAASAAFAYAPIVQDLNQYPLTVAGLKAGDWLLTVDGVQVGRFSAAALAAGVNLATLPGPWRNLGQQVNDLVAGQEQLYHQRRELAGVFSWVPRLPSEAEPEKTALLHKLDEVVAARDGELAGLVRNRTWTWSLTGVGPSSAP